MAKAELMQLTYSLMQSVAWLQERKQVQLSSRLQELRTRRAWPTRMPLYQVRQSGPQAQCQFIIVATPPTSSSSSQRREQRWQGSQGEWKALTGGWRGVGHGATRPYPGRLARGQVALESVALATSQFFHGPTSTFSSTSASSWGFAPTYIIHKDKI